MLKQIVNIAAFLFCFMPAVLHATVKIALIAPKSGEYKIWGDELNFGAKTAIDEINENGGIKGKRLELMSIDDACSDNLAISTAQMLSVGVENKPALVIGPYCSNNVENVAKTYSKAQIFQIIPANNRFNTTAEAEFNSQIGKDFFQFYNVRYAGKKVAFLSNADYQVKAFNSMYNEFRKYGKSSLLTSYTFNDSGLDDFAKDIVSAGEEVVFISGEPKKIAKMIRNIKEKKADMVIVTGKYAVGDSLFEYAADWLDDVYFMAVPSFQDNPDFAEMMVKLRLRGIELTGLGGYAYTAVKTWADLVEKTKSFDYAKLAAKVKNSGLKTDWGEFLLNNGSAASQPHYNFYQYKNGEYVIAD